MAYEMNDSVITITTAPHTDLWQRTYYHFRNDNAPLLQMRVCHIHAAADEISFGISACSPEESSFTAVFSDMKITECMWKAHGGQQPDEL